MATRKPSNDELHYASLISLCKYTVSILGIIGTLFAFAIGWITYSDGKEMRAELKEQRRQMKEEVKEMKSELKEARGVMQTQAEELKQNTLISMDQTKRDALSQISGVKENSTLIAQTQAKKSIDAVFAAKNLDQFIVNIAKERIEPKVKAFVDNSFKEMMAKRKIQIIDDLKQNDKSIISRGLSGLKSYPDLKFTDNEVDLIYNNVYATKDDMLKYSLHQLFLHRPSDVVTRYYLQDAKINFALNEEAFIYFMIHASSRKHLAKVALQLLANVDSKTNSINNMYNDFVWIAFNNNKEASLILLNDIELIDYVYANSTANQLKSSKEIMEKSVKENDIKIILSNTRYFMRNRMKQ